MEVGITRTGLAIPLFRLSGEVLATTWGTAGGDNIAVAFHDEDATTLAVEAALRAAGDGLAGIDLVMSASVSPAYAERSTAAQVAAACDAEAPTCRDFAGSRRAGLGALLCAARAIQAGDARAALVTASDTRLAEPRDPLESKLGHAGAALVVGERPGAVLLAGASAFADYIEAWRVDGERFVRDEGVRLETTEAVVKPLAGAIKKALARAGVAASSVQHVCLATPDPKSAGEVAKACGFDAKSLVSAGAGTLGDLGSAQAIVSLAAGLARAKPNDLLVVAACGDGADALVWRATDQVAEARPTPTLAALVERGRPVPNYARLLAWRKLLGAPLDAPELSNVLLHQEEPILVRLKGYRCAACSLVAYPMARLCLRCRSDQLAPTRLGRRGVVFTFTRDRLFQGVEPEVAVAVVDLDGGGRVFVQMTDCDPKEIDVGKRVELVYRRLHEGGGHPVYYWKARPEVAS